MLRCRTTLCFNIDQHERETKYQYSHVYKPQLRISKSIIIVDNVNNVVNLNLPTSLQPKTFSTMQGHFNTTRIIDLTRNKIIKKKRPTRTRNH